MCTLFTDLDRILSKDSFHSGMCFNRIHLATSSLRRNGYSALFALAERALIITYLSLGKTEMWREEDLCMLYFLLKLGTTE